MKKIPGVDLKNLKSFYKLSFIQFTVTLELRNHSIRNSFLTPYVLQCDGLNSSTAPLLDHMLSASSSLYILLSSHYRVNAAWSW